MKLTDTFNLGEKGYLLRNGYVISILDVPYSTEYHWRTSIITAIKNSLTPSSLDKWINQHQTTGSFQEKDNLTPEQKELSGTSEKKQAT